MSSSVKSLKHPWKSVIIRHQRRSLHNELKVNGFYLLRSKIPAHICRKRDRKIAGTGFCSLRPSARHLKSMTEILMEGRA
jgi:hypothetical protein